MFKTLIQSSKNSALAGWITLKIDFIFPNFCSQNTIPKLHPLFSNLILSLKIQNPIFMKMPRTERLQFSTKTYFYNNVKNQKSTQTYCYNNVKKRKRTKSNVKNWKSTKTYFENNVKNRLYKCQHVLCARLAWQTITWPPIFPDFYQLSTMYSSLSLC